jgi:tetratricopeptide (TPR) repeat protein
LHLYSTQGEILLYLAEWDEAEEWFRRGLTLAEELGNLERQAGYRAGLALCAYGRQDLAGATALLDEARTLFTDQGYWHLQTRIFLWLGEIWLLRGEIDIAWQYLENALDIARTQGRALLNLQGERLRARLLASGNTWAEAQIAFANALEQATAINLNLEIARTQAAWGEAALRRSPADQEARARIASARETFILHTARADLQRMNEAGV